MDILVQTVRKEGFFALYKGSHSVQNSLVLLLTRYLIHLFDRVDLRPLGLSVPF